MLIKINLKQQWAKLMSSAVQQKGQTIHYKLNKSIKNPVIMKNEKFAEKNPKTVMKQVNLLPGAMPIIKILKWAASVPYL